MLFRSWQVPGQPRLRVVAAGGAIHVFAPGRSRSLPLHDPLDRAGAAAVAGNVTRSPMPGLVRAVAVVAGQAVKAGDRLAIIEAMKMEHVLTAARDGVVAEVMVAAGDQVEAGAALIALEEGA